jgi:hypothetical protein
MLCFAIWNIVDGFTWQGLFISQKTCGEQGQVSRTYRDSLPGKQKGGGEINSPPSMGIFNNTSSLPPIIPAQISRWVVAKENQGKFYIYIFPENVVLDEKV